MQIQTATTAAGGTVPPLLVASALLRRDAAASSLPEPDTVFAVPADLGLGPSPRSLPPMRPPSRWVPDVLRSEKLPDGLAVTTSALETAGLAMLLCDPATLVVVPSGHVLRYRITGADGTVAEGHHRPDVVVRRRDGAVAAVTFIHSWERDMASPAWARTDAAVRTAYRRLGVEHRVLTEHGLFARTLRENRGRMLRERAGLHDPDVPRVMEALAGHGMPTTVARFHRRTRPFPARRIDRTLACIVELALGGRVALDLRKPLGPESRITRGSRA